MPINSPEPKKSNQPPKLTVCVVTYNQKYYIESCLQSLIEQTTNFTFEILVGDDCSTDGTSDIVASFADRHPGKVYHLRHESNIGAYKNYIYIHTLASSRGSQYIAHVDGDDCALPGKLDAQVSTLDQNPKIALSAHAVEIIDRTDNIGQDNNLPEYASTIELLQLGAYFVNSSTMYRSKNWVAKSQNNIVVDYYLYIEQSNFGLIHLNKRILGRYRWHDLGISKSPAHRETIEHAYDAAFDLAEKMNIQPNIIAKARLRRRMSFAVAALVDNRRQQFLNKIKLNANEWPNATWNHRILSLGRFFVRGAAAQYLIDRYTGTSLQKK